ncbi:hypothetical protein RIF29_12572 [Crotalaria pallida]|uniref:Uncharacterized protein n=1 Tax=Crotalaria pallida TaxID=3830 RepID=A0AAN9INF3_CROPI
MMMACGGRGSCFSKGIKMSRHFFKHNKHSNKDDWLCSLTQFNRIDSNKKQEMANRASFSNFESNGCYIACSK